MGNSHGAATTRDRHQWSESRERTVARAFELNALDPDFFQNPYPYYHALRRHDPVHRLADDSYVLTRYDDVAAVYRDPRMRSDKTREFRPKFGDGPLYKHHTTSLVFNDPPLHTRVRKLLMPAFTPRALRALEPRIVGLVDAMLDRCAADGGMDVIGDYASALPVRLIADMLGVPEADRGPLRDWSLAILGALEPVIDDRQKARGNAAVAEFSAFLGDLIADRRARPRDDDVLTALIRGQVDGVALSQDELEQNCIFLLNAGHETTTNLIGNAVDALLRFPDQHERLKADPALIEPAVEEFLRFESSNQFGNRRLGEDAEIGGVVMPAGTYIHICIGAANRDPAAFADPDRLDLGRAPNRHLAFGTGIHACAGMSLARMEGRVAIGRLVQRFPAFRRVGDAVRGGRARFRGFYAYPIAIEGAD